MSLASIDSGSLVIGPHHSFLTGVRQLTIEREESLSSLLSERESFSLENLRRLSIML